MPSSATVSTPSPVPESALIESELDPFPDGEKYFRGQTSLVVTPELDLLASAYNPSKNTTAVYMTDTMRHYFDVPYPGNISAVETRLQDIEILSLLEGFDDAWDVLSKAGQKAFLTYYARDRELLKRNPRSCRGHER